MLRCRGGGVPTTAPRHDGAHLRDRVARCSAVVAFSPGAHLARSGAVGTAAVTLRMSELLTSATTASEEMAAVLILAVVAAALKVQLRQANGGVHGASSPRGDSNPQGACRAWQGTLAFLREAVPTFG
jgi:dienelactone hydrolase